MSRFLKVFLSACFLVFLIQACGSQARVAKNDTIPSNQFAFIEFYQTTEGNVLKGEAPPARRIDSPTYTFNQDTREFQIYRMNNVAVDSVKVLLGTGRILKKAAGSGISSVLIGVYDFPFKYSDLEILGISEGKVRFRYLDKSITLEKGQKWEDLKTSIDTINYQGESVIQKVTTTRVQFHGYFQKSLIKKN